MLQKLFRLVFFGTVGALVFVFIALVIIASVMKATHQVKHSGYEVEVFGETIHYADSADRGINADGTPILLLHGSSGNLYDMEWRLAPALQARGFRTISVDRPGLGSSSRNDKFLEDPRAQAALFDGFLASRGVDRAVVLGHSLGNAPTMAMAMNYPDRMIAGVNVAGVSHTWLGEPWILYRMAEWPVFGWFWTDVILPIAGPVILEGMVAGTFYPEVVPEGFIEGTNVAHILQPLAFRSNSQDNLRLKRYMVDMYSDYDKIKVPFLIAWGEGEYVQNPVEDHTGVSVPWWNHGARLEKILPDSETFVNQDVGHMMQHYGVELLADALVVFLDERGLR